MSTTNHSNSPAPNRWVLGVALLFALATFFATAWRASAPPPNLTTESTPSNADSGDQRFSAARARDTLSYVLADQVPHPMGTEANRQVKRRIIEKLHEASLEVREQEAVGCAQGSPHCGFVENVIGTLPGTTDSTIVLMAHYDSTTNSPGAGDDGAGVATIIETVRILAAEAQARGEPYRNTIQAVITDGEEEGLFGAEAFFAEDPDAKRTGALINIEGSGTAGPSNLLRSSSGSGDLVTLYRQTAPHPMASSIATEIFKRMPNDTDFSVGIRAGVKGLDFAFAGERTHYHTPLDSIENLNLGTLQHHGDNVLPLLRRLADADLGSIDGEYSYTTMLDLWLQWRESLSLPLACFGALLLLTSLVLRRRSTSWLATLLGVLATLFILVVTIAACVLALFVADRLAGGTPGWPGTVWPWRLMLLSGATLGTTLVGGPIARRLGFHPMLTGAWLWIAVMALLVAATAPLAASLFVVPLLVMATLGLAVSLFDRDGQSNWWLVAATLGAASGVVYLGGLIPLLEESQGYQLAPAFFVPLAFVLLLLSPLFAVSFKPAATDTDGKPQRHQKPQTQWLALISVVGLLVATLGLVTTPLYTEARPRPVSLRYVQDLDLETARWWALADDPLPAGMSKIAEFEFQEAIVPGLRNAGLVAPARFHSWQTPEEVSTAEAPALEATEITDSGQEIVPSSQTIQLLQEEPWQGGRQVTLRLRSSRGSTVMRMAIDRRAELAGVTIAGRDASNIRQGGTGQYDLISVYAPPPEGVEIVLRLGSAESHEHVVMDIAFELPESAAPLVEARAPLAGPAHSGDRWMAIERFTL